MLHTYMLLICILVLLHSKGGSYPFTGPKRTKNMQIYIYIYIYTYTFEKRKHKKYKKKQKKQENKKNTNEKTRIVIGPPGGPCVLVMFLTALTFYTNR